MALIFSRVSHVLFESVNYLGISPDDNWAINSVKGAANIISGTGYYCIGQAYKCTKNRKYSIECIEHGSQLVKDGLWQFLPGAVGVGIGLGIGSIADKYCMAYLNSRR